MTSSLSMNFALWVFACVGLVALADGARKDGQFLFISDTVWSAEISKNWTDNYIQDTYDVSDYAFIKIPSPTNAYRGDIEKYQLFPDSTILICDDEVTYTSRHVTYSAAITCSSELPVCEESESPHEHNCVEAIAQWSQGCPYPVGGGTLAANSVTGETVFIPELERPEDEDTVTLTVQLSLAAHYPTGGTVNVWSKKVQLVNTKREPFQLAQGGDKLLAAFKEEVDGLLENYAASNVAAGRLPGVYDMSTDVLNQQLDAPVKDVLEVAKGAPVTFYVAIPQSWNKNLLFATPAGDATPDGSYVDPVGDFDAISYHVRAEIVESDEKVANVPIGCDNPTDVDSCHIIASVSNDERFYTVQVVTPTPSMSSVEGGVNVVFYAADKNGAKVDLAAWRFRARSADTDNDESPCQHSGKKVDVQLASQADNADGESAEESSNSSMYVGAFDSSYTCDCSETAGWVGDNCEKKKLPDESICKEGTHYQVTNADNDDTRSAECRLKCPEDVINTMFKESIDTNLLQKITKDLKGLDIAYNEVAPDLEGAGPQQCGAVAFDAEKSKDGKWVVAAAVAPTAAGNAVSTVVLAVAASFMALKA